MKSRHMRIPAAGLLSAAVLLAPLIFAQEPHPALRARTAKGEVFGPRLYAASPALSGQSAQSPEQGEQKEKQ